MLADTARDRVISLFTKPLEDLGITNITFGEWAPEPENPLWMGLRVLGEHPLDVVSVVVRVPKLLLDLNVEEEVLGLIDAIVPPTIATLKGFIASYRTEDPHAQAHRDRL